MKWAVGAFEDGVLKYHASIAYADRNGAERYCEACNRLCSGVTGKTYSVIEVLGEAE